MKKMSVYLAHPISGLTFEKVVEYFEPHVEQLKEAGYLVYDPVTMYTESINKKEVCAPADLKGPLINNHALFERDQWMCTKVDVVLSDLTGATKASIGCVMELAWASLKGVHTVVVMEKGNPHYHGFVLEAADVVFETFDEALDYLANINQ